MAADAIGQLPVELGDTGEGDPALRTLHQHARDHPILLATPVATTVSSKSLMTMEAGG
ncbi:MAG: hypothetical protein R3C69_14170 [Geminicoccaceae bacterium]